MKSSNLIIGSVARLKKIRLYLGMTRKQFGDAIGISQYTIRSWENGAKTFTTDGIQRVTQALKGKIDFSCSFEWLMSGTGSSPISLCEENKIQDNLFISLDSSAKKISNEIVIFKKNNKSADVILVSDYTFSPIANEGDYIGLILIDISSMEKHVNSLVFVTFKNNINKFGILEKKRNCFYIISLLKDSHIKLSTDNIAKISQLIWLRKNY